MLPLASSRAYITTRCTVQVLKPLFGPCPLPRLYTPLAPFELVYRADWVDHELLLKFV